MTNHYVLSHKKQKGGEFLGNGAFAVCVVTPPFKCDNRPDLKKYMNNHYISKLVEYKPGYIEDVEMEIKHGENIKNLDPQGKYFASILANCMFQNQKHIDLVYRKNKYKQHSFDTYYSDSLSNSNDEYDDEYDDNEVSSDKYVSYTPNDKCVIEKDKIYYNLILRNAGKSLKHALKGNDINNQSFTFIKKNLKKIMFHMCNGILLLHNNRIAHKDIKPDNITVKYNAKENKAKINFIDFGLSEQIYDRKYSNNEYRSMLSGGTYVYTPPEIRILAIFLKKMFAYYNTYKSPISYEQLKKLVFTDQKIKDFEKNIITQYNALDLKKIGISIANNASTPTSEDIFYTETDRNLIFDMLVEDFINQKIQKDHFDYFGNFYKWDVYSLGLVFTKCIRKFHITDKKCIDLVNNMINLNFWKRYNIKECLEHPYFKGVTETKHTEIYDVYPVYKEKTKPKIYFLSKTKKKSNISLNSSISSISSKTLQN